MPPENGAVDQLSKRVDDLGTDIRELRGAIEKLTDVVFQTQKLEARVTTLENDAKDARANRFQLKLAWLAPALGFLATCGGTILVTHF